VLWRLWNLPLPPALLSPNQVTMPMGNNPVGNTHFTNTSVLLANLLTCLTFSIQNCNSLNVSTACPKQLKKIKSILDLDTDIVFLSDIRLNNSANIADLITAFRDGSNKKYSFIFNSTKNARGVGILISNHLDPVINHIYKDKEENLLAVNLKLRDVTLNLCSVYGPNRDSVNFQVELNKFLNLFPDCPSVLGGDWNATLSTDPTPGNIDIFRMAAPPSIFRSENIAAMCDDHGLSDPFRVLHPDTRDFSFIPRTRRVNRSRLDFFLISDCLLNNLDSCSISPAPNTELFDHKSVYLKFNKEKIRPLKSINISILTHPRLKQTVLAATIDCYLSHAAPTPGVDLEQGTREVGQLYSLLRDINDIEFDIALNGNSLVKEGLLREKNNDLTDLVNNLPTPEILNTLSLTCPNDVFLDVLLNNIKNDLINLQSWTQKVKNVKKNFISKELSILKGNYVANHVEIAELELELTRMSDEDLAVRIRNMKLFEALNSEKPSTIFLSVAKKTNKGKLSVIKDQGGADFNSEQDRTEHIVSYYEKLYKKPADELMSHSGCIREFLGEDIMNSELVKNSILTGQESENLERPLTIEELDNAAKQGNPSSAPGADGFSMPLLRFCWEFLRHPVFKYTVECLRKGRMTDNFRGASIRLIPKKNDKSDIKNWRPISLLSNLYKIISRALNNRLSEYTNRICSRAQKGFNSVRFTQEAVINVWETIAYCRSNGIRAAILAADMEKAFDSISLGFLEEVYKFFGIGPYMRSLLKMVGSDRHACIILDGGGLSRRFSLERGRPQGDIISPLTFNFCVQILIFKLELDKSVKKIPRLQVADPPTGAVPNAFRCESSRETSNNESLADDNTTVTIFDASSLLAVKTILNDFSKISGLKCNTAKTVVMPTFEFNAADASLVTDMGFNIADNITLLGVKISNKLDTIREIFLNIKEKITNLISFWVRFRLSLPGRICILKTCLISQLCYIGCFLPPPDDILEDIQRQLDTFAKGPLKVSNKRIYLAPNLGGLGCFNIKSFLISQTCSWLVRCFKLRIDNWRFDIVSSAPNNRLELLRRRDITRDSNPILYGFAEAYEKFYTNFTVHENNFKTAYVFDNQAFVRNRSDGSLLDPNFFGIECFRLNELKIRCLKLSDFFRNGRMLTMEELAETVFPVSPALWLRLQSAGMFAWKRYHNPDNNSVPVDIEQFFLRIKKGSKKIRKIMDGPYISDSDPETLTITTSFFTISGSDPQDADTVKRCLGSWNRSALQNNMREFLFKFRNNQLPLNNRLNAIDENVDPRCNFCRIIDSHSNIRDSFEHFFMLCPITRTLLSQFLLLFEPQLSINQPQFKNIYLFGRNDVNRLYEEKILFIMDSFRFTLWQFKIRRKVPNWTVFKRELLFIIETSASRNTLLRSGIQRNNMLANFLPALG
jgi:exonuclease III